MNTLVILAVVVAAATAKPLNEQIVSVTQDTLGNYDLKYAINGISRAEHRDADGLVSGGYSYIDPHGVIRKTIYTAGNHGFHAIGTDIPLPVADTPEVAHAKAAHIELLRAAQLAEPVPVPTIPVAPAAAAVEVPAVKSIPASEIAVAPPAAVLEVPLAPAVRFIPAAFVHEAPVVIAIAPDSPDVLDAEGRFLAGKHLIH